MKRLFLILDELNRIDEEKGSRYLAISNNFLSSDTSKQGTRITMGADHQVGIDIASGKAMVLLLVIDKDEYLKLNPLKPKANE